MIIRINFFCTFIRNSLSRVHTIIMSQGRCDIIFCEQQYLTAYIINSWQIYSVKWIFKIWIKSIFYILTHLFRSCDCIHLGIKEMHKKKKKNTFLNRTTNYLKCYYALKSHQSLPKEQLRQNGILLFGINCECIAHNSSIFTDILRFCKKYLIVGILNINE